MRDFRSLKAHEKNISNIIKWYDKVENSIVCSKTDLDHDM